MSIYKNIFILSFIFVLYSATSLQAACNGGTEIKNTAGTTFCQSNVTMNWWTASAWCKANGMSLATMYDACPSWDGNIGSGKCPEMVASGCYYVWTATARLDTNAYFLYQNAEEVAFTVRQGDGNKALCK